MRATEDAIYVNIISCESWANTMIETVGYCRRLLSDMSEEARRVMFIALSSIAVKWWAHSCVQTLNAQSGFSVASGFITRQLHWFGLDTDNMATTWCAAQPGQARPHPPVLTNVISVALCASTEFQTPCAFGCHAECNLFLLSPWQVVWTTTCLSREERRPLEGNNLALLQPSTLRVSCNNLPFPNRVTPACLRTTWSSRHPPGPALRAYCPAAAPPLQWVACAAPARA